MIGRMKKQVSTFLAILLALGGLLGPLGPDGGTAHAAPAMVWDAVGDPEISTGAASHPTVTIDTYGTPYVAFTDAGNGGKATVMKYNGSNWVAVGNPGFSAGSAGYISLDFYNDTLYMAYSDSSFSSKTTVMKYDDSSWLTVGTPGFSAGQANDISVSVDTYGTPYVTYRDLANGSALAVMKYDGSAWGHVGTPGFSGQAYSPSMVVYNDTPYVSFTDNFNSYKATVMKYDDSLDQWIPVGNRAFSADRADYTSLYIDNGTLYVAYSDNSLGSKTTVMRYDDAQDQWVPVGSPGFSAGEAITTSLYIDNGTLYVAYKDASLDYKATVMKYDDSLDQWVTMGNAGFSSRITISDSLSFAVGNGTPYVVYPDESNSSKATVMTLFPASPSLTADTTDNDGTHDIEITFTDDAAWRSAITAVKVDGVSLAADTDYTITPGKITFPAGQLLPNNYTIAIVASDYARAMVTQPVIDSTRIWKSTGGSSFSSGGAGSTSLSIDNGTKYVAYVDWNNDDKATVKKFDVALGWQLVGDAAVSTNAAYYTSLYVDNGIPYVTYVDSVDGVTVKKYDADTSSWESLGSGLSTNVSSQYTSLYVDNGTPYVAYRDADNSYRITVRKWEGSTWNLVGDVGFSTMSAVDISLYVDNGTPYVSFAESGGIPSHRHVYVMKYVNGWETVGNDYVHLGRTTYTSLYVDNGTPYVAYKNESDDEIYVKKFSSSWELVGNEAVSSENADYPSLVMDDNGNLFVAFSDGGNEDKATVKKYEVSRDQWVLVGSAGFSEGEADFTSLAVDNGTPYIAFMDNGTSNQAFVMGALGTDNRLSDLSFSSGNLGQAFDPETTTGYTATVNVASLTVTPTFADRNATATISVNDGAASSLTSGEASEPLALNIGANTINVVVTAQEGSTSKTYTVTVTRETQPTSSPPPGGTDRTTDGIEPTDLSVTIDGETGASVATAVTSEENGQTVLTATIDSAKLIEQIAGAEDNAVVTIPVTAVADKVRAVLSGDAIQAMEDKNAVVDIQTPIGSYKLPASEVKVDLLAMLLGGQGRESEVTVHVDIAKSDDAKVGLLWDAANSGNFSIVVPPVDFTVTATLGDKSVTIDTFSSFVEREIPIPPGIDSSIITTAVVLNENGTTRPVPMKIVTRDGKAYAVINSLTNSTYSLVSHTVTFNDVANHWAKDAVDDMSSRMVISGIGNGMFNPDQDITRAEFAAIIVRGLGLKLKTGSTSFSDINSSDWYNDVVKTAHANNLINGYEDGTFRPNEKITREQAMAIIARAMTITDLISKLSVQDEKELLSSFADANQVSEWAKSGVTDSLQAEIVSGRSSTQLAPKEDITRAEVAVMIQRLLKKSNLI